MSEILLNYDFDKKIPMYGFGGVPHFPNYTKNEADHWYSCLYAIIASLWQAVSNNQKF